MMNDQADGELVVWLSSRRNVCLRFIGDVFGAMNWNGGVRDALGHVCGCVDLVLCSRRNVRTPGVCAIRTFIRWRLSLLES